MDECARALAVLFVVNALLAVMVVAPLERVAGGTFKSGPGAVDPADVSRLSELHWLQLVLSVLLGTQQVLSWRFGEAPALAAPVAAPGPSSRTKTE